MKLFKGLSKHDLLYGGLIFTFIVLYVATAFVSWYHAITFFNIANAMWLSVILSFVAEIGQASVLFSILLTTLKKFSHVVLSWTVMILLTTLQVIGNVVSSYEWITTHGGAGVEAFQKSILFFMTAADPEIFKVVIAWITGALLPIIALSMTALVAQYMELRTENAKTKLDVDETKTPAPTPMPEPTPEPIPADVIVSEVSKVRFSEEELNELSEWLKNKKPIEKVPTEESEIPLVEGTSLVDVGKLVDDGKVVPSPIEEKKTSPESSKSMTSDEIHQEWTKMYDEIHKELNEEVPPPDQLTQEEVENSLLGIEFTPSMSDEEINEMNQDEYERSGSYMDEDVERLTPLQTEEEIKKVVSEVGDPPIVITHQHGLVDGIVGTQNVEPPIEEAGPPIPESPPTKMTEEEEKKFHEEARLERIRRIAKEQEELKKK